MVKLSRIYTKTGDQGKTSLGNGQRVLKTDLRIEAIGGVDETNAALGLCIAHIPKEAPEATAWLNFLSDCQNDLFDLGADLCLPEGEGLRITPDHIIPLEHAMDQWNQDLIPLTSFVLPGGSTFAAFLHMARTIARRAERSVCRLMHETAQTPLNPCIIHYMNRLSDALFVMARVANNQGESDTLWVPGGKRAGKSDKG